MANEKFILIDGSSMLVTNYYGNLPKALLFEKILRKKRSSFPRFCTMIRASTPMRCTV